MYIERVVIKVELDEHCPSTQDGGQVGWQEVTSKAKVGVNMTSSSTAVLVWAEIVCQPKMAFNSRIHELQKPVLCQMRWLLKRMKYRQSYLPWEDVHWASSNQGLVWCTLSVTPRWRSGLENSFNTRILDLLKLMLCSKHWLLIRWIYAQFYNTKWITTRANDETPARRGCTLSE